MLDERKKISHRYTDGVMAICEHSKANELTKTVYGNVRFQNLYIGLTRRYEASVNNTSVDLYVNCPFLKNLDRHNIVIIGADQYDILVIQENTDGYGDMKLTLHKRTWNMEDKRDGN